MIERELADGGDIAEARAGRVASRSCERRELGAHERDVRDAHDARARIAPGFPNAPIWWRNTRGPSSPVSSWSSRRAAAGQVLALVAPAFDDAEESARQRQHAFVRVLAALDEERAQRTALDREDDQIAVTLGRGYASAR